MRTNPGSSSKPELHARAFTGVSLIAMLLAVTLQGEVQPAAADDRAAKAGATLESADSPVRLHVRVVDTSGRPVVGAIVEVLTLTTKAAESEDSLDPRENNATQAVTFEGPQQLTTDSSGQFQTPRELEGGRAYVISVSSPGTLPGLSRWTEPNADGDVRLADVVLLRLETVTGVVVDRNGFPVAGATVSQSGDGPSRSEAVTDDQGRFRIDGVPEGTAFLFAEKTGYRFYGQRIDTTDNPVRLEQRRSDDPLQRTLRSLPPPRFRMSDQERIDLARKLVAPLFERWETQDAQSEYLYYLVKADPARVLKNVDRSESPFDRDRCFLLLALLPFHDDFENATAAIRLIQRPSTRAIAYFSRDMDFTPQQRIQGLSEAVAIVRRMNDPQRQVNYLPMISKSLIELERYDQARSLLDEARELLDALPPDSPGTRSSYASLAYYYAHFDVSAALDLIDRSEPKYLNSTARVIAATHPKEAERIVRRWDFDPEARRGFNARRSLPWFCYVTARSDPQRAERIANSVLDAVADDPADSNDQSVANSSEEVDKLVDRRVADIFLKAQSLAFIAKAVVDRDRGEAERLLREAVALVRPVRQATYANQYSIPLTPAVVLASFLPIAEAIDPALAHELFWRSLSVRLPPETSENNWRHMEDVSLEHLALMLSRYDRQTARTIVDPVLERNRSRSFHNGAQSRWSATTLLRIGPDAYLEWVNTLADTQYGSRASVRSRAQWRLAGDLLEDEWSAEGRANFHKGSQRQETFVIGTNVDWNLNSDFYRMGHEED